MSPCIHQAVHSNYAEGENFVCYSNKHTLGQNLLIVKVGQMDCNYNLNLSRQKKTFLSLS